MRSRLVLAAAALGAVALVAPHASAAAAPKTLDGKKVTTLTQVADAPMQANDADIAGGNPTESRLQCAPPRCSVLPFVYAPAKGVKADILFTVTWTNDLSDVDLYVAEVGKKGVKTLIANCGGSAGKSEKVFLPAGSLKKGKTYALIADFYRTPGEKVTSKIEMPGKDTVSKLVPAALEGVQKTNCTL